MPHCALAGLCCLVHYAADPTGTNRYVRKRHIAAIAITALATAGVVDSLAASSVERELAKQASEINEFAAIAATPEAYVAGFPFLLATLTGTIPRVSVSVVDVPITEVGVGNAGVEIFNLKLPKPYPERLAAGNLIGAEADAVRRRIRLDGVAFGQLLNITDLDISNPYDISPGGGGASEARLTGTVPGTQEPTSVVVSLRLDGPQFHMRPTQLIDVAPELIDTVLQAYTLDLDTRGLPLGGQADFVQLSGGSIEFSKDRINTVVTAHDLAPLDK